MPGAPQQTQTTLQFSVWQRSYTWWLLAIPAQALLALGDKEYDIPFSFSHSIPAAEEYSIAFEYSQYSRHEKPGQIWLHQESDTRPWSRDIFFPLILCVASLISCSRPINGPLYLSPLLWNHCLPQCVTELLQNPLYECSPRSQEPEGAAQWSATTIDSK